MLNIDRHIGISAGWVAGPAFAVAMMAAPEYLHFGPLVSGLLFWGGILLFLATVAVLFIISIHEKDRQKVVLGPVLTMTFGALIFCGGVAWYLWPHHEELAGHSSNKDGRESTISETSKGEGHLELDHQSKAKIHM